LIEEAAASALPEDSGVVFENRVPPRFQIDADSEQLFRVLLNVFSNARDALDSIGTTKREKRIVVEAWRKDCTVTVDIADTGPGIPSSVRDRLFQPFAGTARAGGSGLGLAISRELLQAHGGDIVLVSTDPSGTRVRLIIPDRTG